ncbi:hypothetical protein K466DRAFT_61376 [Polyporus arcularius HHB13444]|uniref:Secreted protein n=1 Tax=Polyporus arcularius HHB13444 TaxID=1314778 RepID=A0A5C3PG26_9APHY|nr:hypothetical protein K466DRAFT_61376 [Polyporus arcularius HHB13444]
MQASWNGLSASVATCFWPPCTLPLQLLSVLPAAPSASSYGNCCPMHANPVLSPLPHHKPIGVWRNPSLLVFHSNGHIMLGRWQDRPPGSPCTACSSSEASKDSFSPITKCPLVDELRKSDLGHPCTFEQ